jgi:hypothetical protein
MNRKCGNITKKNQGSIGNKWSLKKIVVQMTDKQKQDVKQAAKEFYRDRRISLEMAAWAMKNAGYTREETAEWLEISGSNTANERPA